MVLDLVFTSDISSFPSPNSPLGIKHFLSFYLIDHTVHLGQHIFKEINITIVHSLVLKYHFVREKPYSVK